ncbi:Acylphosphate phosphohydrolase, putative [Caenispirillum salinarum AK4]|uniref:acylphosphatase n=1 Tax=Caenispirillum salinarum AK4 TaxID=1238182 RepID=K9GTE6_9PROT|nr:acylphosphatase [Caenispirillum salinarum]EKV29270.1 Acylphosphate phosphohydrolase, putative [Caenispirillum salinarum AK4]
MKTVRAIITGRVQGVFYRGWTEEQAQGLGLSGWVRNKSDGSVEAVFHGPAEAVDDMLRRCHDGPTAARVEQVSAEPYDGDPGQGFQQTG